jgi:hypothetical protein
MKEVFPYLIEFSNFSLRFFKQLLMTIFSFSRVGGLQRAIGFQLLTLKVEGREHIALGLQLSTSKVEVQEHSSSNLQLSVSKVQDRKPKGLGLQFLVLKVED